MKNMFVEHAMTLDSAWIGSYFQRENFIEKGSGTCKSPLSAALNL